MTLGKLPLAHFPVGWLCSPNIAVARFSRIPVREELLSLVEVRQSVMLLSDDQRAMQGAPRAQLYVTRSFGRHRCVIVNEDACVNVAHNHVLRYSTCVRACQLLSHCLPAVRHVCSANGCVELSQVRQPADHAQEREGVSPDRQGFILVGMGAG